MFKILAHGATHVGRERKNNEDAFRVAPEAGLYLVCDGMGGHASGEIASQIAADALVRVVARDMSNPDYVWPAATPQGLVEEARILDAAVRTSNAEVFAAANENPLHKGMGTTVVGMLAGPQRLGLVHVGDSRIYRMRGGELTQLTEDHSLLNFYIQTRPMSAEQIKQFAGKNVIVRAVGLRDAVEPDVQVQEYVDGDVYMLCSDGVTDMVDDAILAATLKDCGNRLVETTDQVIDHALAGGGKDNITVLLMRIIHVPDEPRSRLAARPTLPMDVVDDLSADDDDHSEDTSPGFDLGHGDPSDAETLTEIEVAQTGLRKHAKTQEVPYRPWKDFELNAPRKPGLPLPVRRPISNEYDIDTSAPTDPMGTAAARALEQAAKLLGTAHEGSSPAAILAALDVRGIDPRRLDSGVARTPDEGRPAPDTRNLAEQRAAAFAVTQKANVPAGLPPFRPSQVAAVQANEEETDMAETIRPESGLTSSVAAALRAVAVVEGSGMAGSPLPTSYQEDTERVVRPARPATEPVAPVTESAPADAKASLRSTAVDRPHPLRAPDVPPPHLTGEAPTPAELRAPPPANPLTALDLNELPAGLPLDDDDEASF